MKSLRTGAALLALLFLALYARPLYSQAQTLMFGSYSGSAKAVTVTSAGAVNVSISGGAGTVSPTNGGTGQNSSAWSALPKVTAGVWAQYTGTSCTNQFVRSLSALGVATCSSVALATDVSGTLPAANGGTGQSSYTIGDLLYATSSSALSKLAGVAVGKVLVSGGVGAAPSWSTTIASGTITTSAPHVISQTWNAGAVAFDGLQIDITNTAASASSRPFVVTNGAGGRLFEVGVNGNIVSNSNAQINGNIVVISASGENQVQGAGGFVFSGRARMDSPADGQISFRTAATSSGICLDVNTDQVFKIMTRATCAAYATLDALAYKLSGVLLDSTTAPTIASGGCTSPAVTHSNGTAAFLLTLGTSCSAVKTIVLTMPAAAHFWKVTCDNNTSDAQQASNYVVSRATSTTAVTITNYGRVLGTQADFTASDTLLCSARPE